MGENCFKTDSFRKITNPMFYYSIFLFLLLTITGCQESATKPFTEEDHKTVAADVRETLFKYYEEINQSGLMSEFAYLDSSDDFFWVPPGYTSSIGYDSVAAFIRQAAPAYKQVNNTWDSLRIIPLSNELASYYGRLRSVMTDTAGRMEDYFLLETGLMIKRKDGWKLLHGHTVVLP